MPFYSNIKGYSEAVYNTTVHLKTNWWKIHYPRIELNPVEIGSAVYRDNHVELALMYGNMGNVYNCQSNYDHALPIY